MVGERGQALPPCIRRRLRRPWLCPWRPGGCTPVAWGRAAGGLHPGRLGCREGGVSRAARNPAMRIRLVFALSYAVGPRWVLRMCTRTECEPASVYSMHSADTDIVSIAMSPAYTDLVSIQPIRLRTQFCSWSALGAPHVHVSRVCPACLPHACRITPAKFLDVPRRHGPGVKVYPKPGH